MAIAMMLCAVLLNFIGSWFGAEESVLRLGRSLLWETRRAEALRERAKAVSESTQIKREILDRLLARRLHMSEAIERFQRANEIIENDHLYSLPTFRTPTDREGVGRQVLAWVNGEVASWPEDRDKSIVEALEAEYRELFEGPDSQQREGRNREPNEAQKPASVRGADRHRALRAHSSPPRGLW